MKKRNIMKTLFAGTMTLGMALSISPAFATGDYPEWNEGDTPNVVITKNLNVAADAIAFDDMTFTFNFNLKDDTVAAELEDSLKSFTATATIKDNDTGTGVITGTTDNILNGKKFPAAGVYTYEVKESQDDDKGEKQYGLTCSDAEYEMKVYVKNGTKEPYVYSVTVLPVKDDNGQGINNAQKVDPTPDQSDGTSKFVFTNSFTKKAGGDEADAKSLTITKNVAGDYGDKTRQFQFTVSINLPSYVDSSNGYVGMVGDTTYTFNSTNNFTCNNVMLADGDVLEFSDLPAGTKYSVTEAGTENYTPSASIIENGKSPTSENANKGEGLTVTNKLVGEKANSTTFTNTHNVDSITPTGIIINNLPFVLMVVVAGSGLALYVVSKRRSHQ